VSTALGPILAQLKPDMVIVQGDTTTAAAAALCAFERGIPVAHVEAGLRSFDPANPWPEEMNRVLIDRVASLRFAPTRWAKENLLREGLEEGAFVTGNTVVDALRWALRQPKEPHPLLRSIPPSARVVLCTLHRRESFGAPLRGMLGALKRLAEIRPDVLVVFFIHPNPEVRRAARGLDHPRVRSVPPAPYPSFLSLLRRADLVLTDSGGLQEEAPSLHKPVLVARKVTERPELLAAGGGTPVGTDPGRIIREACRLLDDRRLYAKMSSARNPFGDGRASERIARAVLWHFGLGPKPRDWAGAAVLPSPL
jgi:UDP-N-acetylglucosamine 2-epimerase (non-hydrolysing)